MIEGTNDEQMAATLRAYIARPGARALLRGAAELIPGGGIVTEALLDAADDAKAEERVRGLVAQLAPEAARRAVDVYAESKVLRDLVDAAVREAGQGDARRRLALLVGYAASRCDPYAARGPFPGHEQRTARLIDGLELGHVALLHHIAEHGCAGDHIWGDPAPIFIAIPVPELPIDSAEQEDFASDLLARGLVKALPTRRPVGFVATASGQRLIEYMRRAAARARKGEGA